jgi:hypothetical protein
MQKLFGCVLMVYAIAVPAGTAEAGDLNLTIANGRVTLIAHDVTIRQILDEWERVGQTRIVNGDKLLGAPITIELRDVPEAKALETILRSAAGYLVALRAAGSVGASNYDRILILPTSRAPVVAAAPAAAPFNRPTPPPQTMPVENDDEPAPAVGQPPMPTAGQPFPGPPPQGAQQPGMHQPVMQQPGMSQPAMQQPGTQQPVTTLPRPGQLPPAPNTPGNPYQPNQPVRPPGGGGGGSPNNQQ